MKLVSVSHGARGGGRQQMGVPAHRHREQQACDRGGYRQKAAIAEIAEGLAGQVAFNIFSGGKAGAPGMLRASQVGEALTLPQRAAQAGCTRAQGQDCSVGESKGAGSVRQHPEVRKTGAHETAAGAQSSAQLARRRSQAGPSPLVPVTTRPPLALYSRLTVNSNTLPTISRPVGTCHAKSAMLTQFSAMCAERAASLPFCAHTARGVGGARARWLRRREGWASHRTDQPARSHRCRRQQQAPP